MESEEDVCLKKEFNCNICKKKYSRKKCFQKHVSNHKEGKFFKCNFCDMKYPKRSLLKLHIQSHDKVKPFKCSICHSKFFNKHTLERHVFIHTSNKPHKCSFCSRSFSHTADLKKHIRTHTGEKPYECDVCRKRFARNTHLRDHSLTHKDIKPFKCSLCDKCFIRKDAMMEHFRTHKEKLTCEICNYKFLRKSDLKRHYNIHTGQKKFECELCHKVYARGDRLQTHIKGHASDGLFKCNKCDLIFSRDDLLQKHNNIHTNKKKFESELCHKVYTRAARLKTLMNGHASNVLFECNECDLIFSRDDHLQKHILLHNSNTQFSCVKCHQTFSKHTDFDAHMQSHFEKETITHDLKITENGSYVDKENINQSVILKDLDGEHSQINKIYISNKLILSEKSEKASGTSNFETDLNMQVEKSSVDKFHDTNEITNEKCDLKASKKINESPTLVNSKKYEESTYIIPAAQSVLLDIIDDKFSSKKYTIKSDFSSNINDETNITILSECNNSSELIHEKPSQNIISAADEFKRNNVSKTDLGLCLHNEIEQKSEVLSIAQENLISDEKHDYDQSSYRINEFKTSCDTDIDKNDGHSQVTDLNKHLSNQVSRKIKLLKCHICDKAFTNDCKLQIHIRKHTDKKAFLFEIRSSKCHKRKKISKEKFLKSHLRTHKCAKYFECDVCQKKFFSTLNFKKHYLIHTNENHINAT